MYLTNTLFTLIGKKERPASRALSTGWVALFVMILAGSTNPAFGKQLTGTFSPLSMLLLSEVLMLLFAMLSFGFLPTFRHLLKIRRRQLLFLVIAGSINGIIAPLCWFSGLHATSAVNAELFSMTEMIFLMLLSVFVLRQPLGRSHVFGGTIVLFGVTTVALQGFTDGLTLGRGDLFIMLSCFLFAMGGTIVRKELHRLEPQLIILVRSAIAISFFFLISPFRERPFIDEVQLFPLVLLPILLSYGFVSRFLLVFSYYEAIERLPVATFSLFSTLVVAGATLFAHFYLGEPIHWYQAAGGGLIIFGASLVHLQGLLPKEVLLRQYLKSHSARQ
ncbi:MAG: DMT family transporter [Candidatus Peribacteraceae bacterium]|nr:DMT family transporter [Candidatus Peribacteraceae bacterium]